jgi:hypothetical protein
MKKQKKQKTKPSNNQAGEKIVINPPEKIIRPVQEQFVASLQEQLLTAKVRQYIESKSTKQGISYPVLEGVFLRGILSPTPEHLTVEQHAINRVNSFVAGGEAFEADIDLLEKLGMKGTGGGARPHLKSEINPYNGQRVYHVLDAKGRKRMTAKDKPSAQRYLATHYNSFFEEAEYVAEVSSDLLARYKKKAGEEASAADKRGDFKHADKRFSGIMKATKKQFSNDAKKYQKEEADQLFTTLLKQALGE